MHTRRLIAFLLGCWFLLVAGVPMIGSISQQVAVNVAQSPPPEPGRALNVIGPAMTDQLFRFIGSEIARSVIESSGWLELALVFGLVLLLFFQDYSRLATILCGVLLLAALASRFLLTPQLVSYGRLLDFRPAEMAQVERMRFYNIQLLFWVVWGIRLLLGVVISGVLLKRTRSVGLRRRKSELDSIDDA